MKRLFLLLLLLTSLWVKSQTVNVGMLQATDPEGQEVFWTISSGNTAGFFSITPCSGIVKMDSLAYNAFVYQKTWTIVFKASDPQGNYSKTTRKILVKKVNGIKQTPVISNAL